MKKLFTIMSLLAATTVIAQTENEEKPHFSVGVEVAVPATRFENVNSHGFGLSGKFFHPLFSGLATLQVSYISFDGKSLNDNIYGTFTAVPVKLGYRFSVPFIDKDFYVEPQAGIAFNQRAETKTVSSYTDNTFNYGLRAGVRINKKFDVDLRGETFSFRDKPYIYGGLHVGYIF